MSVDKSNYVCDYHMVFLIQYQSGSKYKLIGYILISLDESSIYVYDIYMISRYKSLSESSAYNPSSHIKTLYNRTLTEVDRFILEYNLSSIINPEIVSPRIRNLIHM